MEYKVVLVPTWYASSCPQSARQSLRLSALSTQVAKPKMPYHCSEEDDAQGASPTPLLSFFSDSSTTGPSQPPSPAPAWKVGQLECQQVAQLRPLGAAFPEQVPTENKPSKYHEALSKGQRLMHGLVGSNTLRPRWEVTDFRVGACNAPVFIAHVGPVAWPVSDVIDRDSVALRDFCANFEDWERFFTSKQDFSGLYVTEDCIPGMVHDLEILNIGIWGESSWMVLVEAKVAVGVEHICACKDLLEAVLAYLRREAPNGSALHIP